eukprot:SAG11_NODE_2572_length_3210_cov_18.286725_1_plen_92_part_10
MACQAFFARRFLPGVFCQAFFVADFSDALLVLCANCRPALVLPAHRATGAVCLMAPAVGAGRAALAGAEDGAAAVARRVLSTGVTTEATAAG